MAALSLSPAATRQPPPTLLLPPTIDFSAIPSMPIVNMSTARRPPLGVNPNAANSPLRGAVAAKAKRSIASIQREEAYGQPPPLKKQMLEGGSQRAVRSPGSLASRSRPVLHVQRARSLKPQAAAPSTETFQSQRVHEKDFISWQKQYRSRFPRMVFFFDSVPDDIRAKLVKHITYLGAVSPRVLLLLFFVFICFTSPFSRPCFVLFFFMQIFASITALSTLTSSH